MDQVTALPFDYIGQALCTKSDKFYGGQVALDDLQRAIDDVIVAGNKLDAIKKALFYGKVYPRTDERYAKSCVDIAVDWFTPETQTTPAFMWHETAAIDIIHAIIGKATEAVEGLELLSRTIKTKIFDPVNAKEETFDGQWYDAILCNAIGITFEDGQRNNIAKLRKRFGDKFSEYDAVNRDLGAEREVLEVKPSLAIADPLLAEIAEMEARNDATDVERIWVCKIGGKIPALKGGADGPMREAVQDAFLKLTGVECEYAFTGWDGKLTALERGVVNNDDDAALDAAIEQDKAPQQTEVLQLPTRRQFIGKVNWTGAVNEAELMKSTDPALWAQEFAKVCPSVDSGLMIGWFANAFEVAKRSAIGEL